MASKKASLSSSPSTSTSSSSSPSPSHSQKKKYFTKNNHNSNKENDRHPRDPPESDPPDPPDPPVPSVPSIHSHSHSVSLGSELNEDEALALTLGIDKSSSLPPALRTHCRIIQNNQNNEHNQRNKRKNKEKKNNIIFVIFVSEEGRPRKRRYQAQFNVKQCNVLKGVEGPQYCIRTKDIEEEIGQRILYYQTKLMPNVDHSPSPGYGYIESNGEDNDNNIDKDKDIDIAKDSLIVFGVDDITQMDEPDDNSTIITIEVEVEKKINIINNNLNNIPSESNNNNNNNNLNNQLNHNLFLNPSNSNNINNNNNNNNNNNPNKLLSANIYLNNDVDDKIEHSGPNAHLTPSELSVALPIVLNSINQDNPIPPFQILKSLRLAVPKGGNFWNNKRYDEMKAMVSIIISNQGFKDNLFTSKELFQLMSVYPTMKGRKYESFVNVVLNDITDRKQRNRALGSQIN